MWIMTSETPTKNIFDYYTKDENNFTKALINVMETAFYKKDKIVITAFLTLLKPSLSYSNDLEFRLLKGMDGGTYDAAIFSEKKNYYLAIETKIKEKSLKIKQLQRHCKNLKQQDNYKTKLLITITPDLEKGNFIRDIGSIKCESKHLSWKKIFEKLNEVRKEPISETTTFLIDQFNGFLDNELLNTNFAGGIVKAIPAYFPEDYENELFNDKTFWNMNRLYLGLEGGDKVMVIYKSESREIIGEAIIESIEENDDQQAWGQYRYLISKTVKYPKPVPRNKIEKKIKYLGDFFSGRPSFSYITKDELAIIRKEAGYRSDYKR